MPAAAAAKALGSTRHPKAFATLVAGIDRASRGEVIAAASADGLVALQDERGIDVLVERTRYGEPELRRFAMAFGFFLGMICSALLIARVHAPRPRAGPT